MSKTAQQIHREIQQSFADLEAGLRLVGHVKAAKEVRKAQATYATPQPVPLPPAHPIAPVRRSRRRRDKAAT